MGSNFGRNWRRQLSGPIWEQRREVAEPLSLDLTMAVVGNFLWQLWLMVVVLGACERREVPWLV